MTTSNNQKNYSFNFDYLNSTFIHVTLNGKELEQPKDFTVNQNEVLLKAPPQNGVFLIIYRVTPSNRIVSWTDNSILKADNLNLSYIQLMHLAEEQMDNVRDETITRALDEAWDVKGSRIKHVGNPTEDADAVPYGYVRHQKEEVEQLTAEVRQHKASIEQTQRDVLSRQSAVDATAQRTNELAQRVTEQMNTNNMEFTNKVTKAKADIAGLSQETNTAIADKLSKATTAITQLGERTTTDVTSRINSAKSDLTQQLTNATNTINSKVATVNREIDTRINNTTSAINDRITSAKQELTAHANNVTSTLNTTIRTANEVKEQIESASEKLKSGVLDEKTKSDIANSLLSKQEALINNRIAENNLAQASVHEAVITRKINENNTSQARANESLITSKISANNSTLKSEVSSDITSKINANNSTLKADINSTITTKISEHNTDTNAHNLNKYMSMKPMPNSINDWNNLTDTGMYEATASMWGWRNAPSTTRVYYYGVVQVIKSDTNKITQVFYSYGANNKPCNICYRTFYNAWGSWHYHGDYEATVTDIVKHNEGLTITKGDTATLLKLFTNNKADTNTSLVPTLAVVKELLGNANVDITELLKSKGVRYDFSNESAWYLCLGQAFGGLIIQGGIYQNSTDTDTVTSFPIAFPNRCLIALRVGYKYDEEYSTSELVIKEWYIKSVTNSSFRTDRLSYKQGYKYIALGI